MFRYCLIFLVLAITLVHCQDCSPPERDGVCPPLRPDTSGICVEGCSGDGDCETPLKCCSNGCGHVCTQPDKPGSCPPLKEGTVGTCDLRCSGDSSCPNSQKCCSNGCGNRCVKPVFY